MSYKTFPGQLLCVVEPTHGMSIGDIVEVRDKNWFDDPWAYSDDDIICIKHESGYSFHKSRFLPISKKLKDKIQSILSKNAKPSITEEIIVYSQIIEIQEEHVILKCLVDKEEKVFQKRKFNKKHLEGFLDLKEGELVEIRIVIITHGEKKITYCKADKEQAGMYFERKFFFPDKPDPIFLEPLPKEDN